MASPALTRGNDENFPLRREDPSTSSQDSWKPSYTGRSYFAFIPRISDATNARSAFGGREHNEQHPTTFRNGPRDGMTQPRFHEDRQAEEGAWQEHKRQEEEARRKRREKEIEVASAGEIEWVRSGGVLRDAQGRRDKVRTEMIVQELRLQQEEKLLVEEWESYERRWRSLLLTTGCVTFGDIPWPMQTIPSSTQELTSAAIRDFLLASLRVRSNTVSKKDRLRTSLLRWHPDKMTSILSRIAEDDVQRVREGVSIVFNVCLTALQDM